MITSLVHITLLIQLISQLFAVHTPEPKEKLRLIWSDEFKGSGTPDTTNWTYDIGHGYNGWGNNELQKYTRAPENIYLKGGKLVIDAIKKDGQWTSARIKSQGRKSWTYGKIVFRAKLPNGKGTWPALWMLGENIASVGWPTCGEIDIMEHVGRNPTVIQAAMHNLSSHGETVNKNSKIVATFDTEFHTYEALWTKNKIEFFIDGVSYYTYQPEVKDKKTWPYDEPFFLIMNIAIGGGFGGDVDPSLNFARMEIDYVRVYALSDLKS